MHGNDQILSFVLMAAAAYSQRIEGVTARVAQRLLAMTAACWHNRATGQPTTRSLITGAGPFGRKLLVLFVGRIWLFCFSCT